MNVRELIDALEDYGDHLDVLVAAENAETGADLPLVAVDSANRPDGVVVLLVPADGD